MSLSLYQDGSVLDFDAGESSLSLKQVPVRYQGKSYILVEALGDAVAQWRNAQLQGTRMQQSDGSDLRTIQLGGLADSEPLLVSLCLFQPGPNDALVLDGQGNIDTRHRVKQSVVRGWPNRVVSRLFETIKDMSGLDPADTVESLEKQIADLHKRLAKLKAGGEPTTEDALAKN